MTSVYLHPADRLVDKLLVEPSSDLELAALASKNGIPLVGIISREQVGPKTKKPGCYLVNMDDVDSSGTHWVALYLMKNSPTLVNGEYFDSFGLPPPKSVVRLSDNGTIRFNDWQIQTKPEMSCGLYCLAYLKARLAGKSFDEIVEKLFTPADKPNSAKKNSIILKRFLSTG